MHTVTISISPQQANRIQQAVDTGRYASGSAVLRDALQLWELRENIRVLEEVGLQKSYDDGLASSAFEPITAVGDSEQSLAEHTKSLLQSIHDAFGQDGGDIPADEVFARLESQFESDNKAAAHGA